jgi:type IV secretory pathway VirB10-like protein
VPTVLPSLRLIAATFLCSFLIVFVGIRLAATSRVAHENAGRATTALPLQLTGADAAADMRRIGSDAPVMFDLRFAMGATAPASVPSGLTMHALDRAKRESGFELRPPETKTEAQVEPKPETKIEVAALPEPSSAAADAPPPPPGPPPAVAALETATDVESVGTTESAATKPVPKKPAVAAKRKVKKKVVRQRARTKQAAQIDLSAPVFNPFPNNP